VTFQRQIPQTPSFVAVKDLDFLIAGTGRSGSRWISHIFSALGFECGHERIFNPWMATRDTGRVGDSAFECVPFLDECKTLNPDLKVFLQTRNPLGYIHSILGTGGFEKVVGYNSPHAEFQLGYVKPKIELGNQVETAINMWINWNEMARPFADVVYRVEDVYFPLMRDLIAELGGEITKEDFNRAESVAQDSRNAHPKTHQRPAKEIFASPSYSKLKAVAVDYGYII